MQKLDYYFFKAEKLIPDIAKITEGWDRIHLVVQWYRPFWFAGIVCLGMSLFLIYRQENTGSGKLSVKNLASLRLRPEIWKRKAD